MRGSGLSSASSPSGPQAQSGTAAGASAWAAAAAAAVLGLVARHARSGQQPRCSLVACAGKKRGGGGKRGGDQGEPPSGDGEEEPAIDTEAIVKEYSSKMENTLTLLRDNLATIRAGRASPALLDSVKVNAYDSEVTIKEVGTITVQDSTTLIVACFDESVAPNVEKALLTASLGYSVQAAGPNIKVGIPTLTKEKRTQYAKMAKDFTEKSRVAVRNVRQAAMKKVKGVSKKLSEDVVKSLQDEIEAQVKKNMGECDKIFKAKESEILNG